MSTLAVSEIFGPTFQGEGPSLGRRAGFVRLGRCNLDCGAGEGATWACDTPYTWDWRGKLGHVYDPAVEVHPVDVEMVVQELTMMEVPLVVITGGEPLLALSALEPLIRLLWRADLEVEIETNGTRRLPHWILGRGVRFNVSPKLANSGVERHRAWVLEALRDLVRAHASFKFVVAGTPDLEEVAELAALVPLDPQRIWIMPAGTSAEEIEGHLLAVADGVLERGWNLTTRLHVQLWGDKRGV